MKKAILYFAFLMVSSVIFSACVHKPAEENVTTNELTAPVAGEVIDKSVEGAVDYALDLSNFNFSPALIEASPGETITVKISSVQGFHDFVIDELDARSKQINVGQEEIITITIPEDASGEVYEFYCSVGNHREQGMVGVLRVR